MNYKGKINAISDVSIISIEFIRFISYFLLLSFFFSPCLSLYFSSVSFYFILLSYKIKKTLNIYHLFEKQTMFILIHVSNLAFLNEKTKEIYYMYIILTMIKIHILFINQIFYRWIQRTSVMSSIERMLVFGHVNE